MTLTYFTPISSLETLAFTWEKVKTMDLFFENYCSLQEVGTNVYINIPGHMTKMAAMPIFDKNPSKIFFSKTGRPISTKLGIKHLRLKYYNEYINHEPAMTLTHFMARSSLTFT